MKRYKFENKFMQLAFQEAQKGFEENEVPVGCVIVHSVDSTIISHTRNSIEQNKNPNAHAEMLAINIACCKLSKKSLFECDMYVTLEPCTMCAAAIANAKIRRVYYSAASIKYGAVENGLKFFNSLCCFHRPEIYAGILEEKSVSLLKKFFAKLKKVQG